MTTNSAEYPMSTLPPAVTDERASSGASLLASIEDLFRRHVVVPVGVPLVLALWTISTYLSHVFDHYPYIALVSPVKRCGKTTVLKLLAKVARRPEFTVNITDAALFRLVDDRRPTLLMDEAEDLQRSSLRAILNAGFEQGATVPRCVGQDVHLFQVFCPKALACIGRLPETIADRSIIVRMKRKKRGEKVDELRRRTLADAAPLTEEIRRWVADNERYVAEAYNDDAIAFLPSREADLWEGLFATIRIAAPDRIHELKDTATRLAAEKEEEEAGSEMSIGIRLLSDVKAVFAAEATENMPTSRLLGELRSLPDGIWPRLSANELARKLRPFEIVPKQLWLSGKNVRGYSKSDFADAFERYIPRAEDDGAEDSPQTANKPSDLAALAAKAGEDS